MTTCGLCTAGLATANRARVVILRGGSEARVVCLACSTDYARSRTYTPAELPPTNRIDLDVRGRDRPFPEILAELAEGSA